MFPDWPPPRGSSRIRGVAGAPAGSAGRRIVLDPRRRCLGGIAAQPADGRGVRGRDVEGEALGIDGHAPIGRRLR